jgi:hypothetical protein
MLLLASPYSPVSGRFLRGEMRPKRAALAAVQKVLTGNAPPGFQTPALAYGADFVLECAGVTREDVK